MKIIGYINVIGFKYSDDFFYSIDLKKKIDIHMGGSAQECQVLLDL